MKRTKRHLIVICIVVIIGLLTACQLSQENIINIEWIKQNEGTVKLLLIVLNGSGVLFLRQSYITKQKRTAEEWSEFAVLVIIGALLLETFIACEYNISNEDLKLIISVSILGTAILVAKSCAIKLLPTNQKSKKSRKNVSYIVLFIILIRGFLWKENYYTLHIIGSVIALIGWHRVYYHNKNKEEFYQ